MKKRLVIIDSNSVVYRAFYALPPLTTKAGELINALYGFLLVLFKVVRELKPDYLAAIFDFPAPTFRHQKFEDYKIKRPPMPEGIKEQIPKLKEVLRCFNICILEKEGFEADDLIATIVSKVNKESKEIEIIILSGDSDLLSLINPQTKVFLLQKGTREIVLYDQEKIKEKYCLLPPQLIDFKALKGDPSDNIPGIAGIGEKTALKLIQKFDSLENLYEEIEKGNLNLDNHLLEKLKNKKADAFFSKSLIQLDHNVPMTFDLNCCLWQKFNKDKAIEILQRYEFQSLVKKIKDILPESGFNEIKNKTLF